MDLVFRAPEGSDNGSSEFFNVSVRGNNTGEPISPASRQLWLSPVPDWDTATVVWGVAWPLHTYAFATLFLCACLVTSILLWRIMSRKRSATQASFRKARQTSGMLPPPVLTLIIIATFLRALILFVDPYRSKQRLPVLVVRTLANLPFTCFLSAYQLLFLALHSSLKLRFGSLSWLQNRFLIAAAVAGFMIFNTTVDIVLVLVVSSRTLLLVCMIANLLWAAVIVAELTTIVLKLQKRIRQGAKSLSSSPGHGTLQSCQNGSVDSSPHSTCTALGINRKRRPSLASSLGRRLTQSSLFKRVGPQVNRNVFQRKIVQMALCLIFSVVIYMLFLFYYVLGVAGALSFDSLIRPWTWYVVATLHRLAELHVVLVIVTTMNVTSGQRSRVGASHSDADSVRSPSSRVSAPDGDKQLLTPAAELPSASIHSAVLRQVTAERAETAQVDREASMPTMIVSSV